MAEYSTDDLIAMLASAPDRLDAALAARGASAHDWTTSEIVGHLSDSARYWGARMLLAVHEDRPELPVFDQDALVKLAAYRYASVETLARIFRLTSEANVALLRGLTAEQWQRVGVHPERGPLTLQQIVEIEAKHELEHTTSLAPTHEG